MKASIRIAVIFLTLSTVSYAQSQKSKIEIGVQATSLTLFGPGFPDFTGDVSELGVGGRVTYNFNKAIAAEAEVNFFPAKNSFFIGNGRSLQAQFGIKAGKRFEKFGVFAKVHPGFLTLDDVFSVQPGSTATFEGITIPNARIARETYFTTDIGGVLELYPTDRVLVRFDVGDTLVRYPSRLYFGATSNTFEIVRSSKVKNNFQFTAGVGFRLGTYGDSEDAPNTNKQKRYEVGAQFTSMSINQPRRACFLECFIDSGDRNHTEPGFGGRFTYNLTRSLAVEAESNFFTRKLGHFTEPGGYMFHGQFGVKAGKRFQKWGLFGKARPGFVGFTQAFQLVGTHTQPFGNLTITVGDFRVTKELYPSMDVGGVVEFYVSRRWMTRMDFGDTIIRYGEYKVPGTSAVTNPIFTRGAETHHNFQLSAGIGMRFE